VSAPTPEIAAPEGYVSADARRAYLAVALILLGCSFLIQVSVPMVGMYHAMARGMFGNPYGSPMVFPRRGAVWKGELYYFEQPFGIVSNLVDLKALPLKGPKPPRAVHRGGTRRTWLLASGDRLWLIDAANVHYYMEGQMSDVSPADSLGSFSPPFLYEGKPAVISDRSGRAALTVFEDSAWVDRTPLPPESAKVVGSAGLAGVRVVQRGGKLFAFARSGGKLHWREGFPSAGTSDSGAWRIAGEVNHNWQVIDIGGTPVVFEDSGDNPLKRSIVGRKLTPGGLRPFFSMKAPLVMQFGVYAGQTPGTFHVITQSMMGANTESTVTNGTVVRETRLSGGQHSYGRYMAMMSGAQAGQFLLAFAFACVLTLLMRRYRTDSYVVGDRSVRHASLARRAAAWTVDWVIISVPLTVYYATVLSRFHFPEDLFKWRRALTTAGLGLLALLWALAWFIVFCVYEGKRGVTPGKRIVGIRVLGADLAPCGVGRALVRNLVAFVDAMFGYTVGLLLVSLSSRWQRLSDMAARTVVIRQATADRMGPPQR